MKKSFSVVVMVLFSVLVFAQNGFQGVFTVNYKNMNGDTSIMKVFVKDSMVLFTSVKNGNPKYENYLLNLSSRKFYTVSRPDKKIVLSYNIDKLSKLYEDGQMKEGYKVNSTMTFKSTDKTKEEDGRKITRYNGEDEIHSGILWQTDLSFNFNQLIPVLRLLNCWSEAQTPEGFIVKAEVRSKVSPRESFVWVSLKEGEQVKEKFQLPKDYQTKNFERLMDAQKDNPQVYSLIQRFAEF